MCSLTKQGRHNKVTCYKHMWSSAPGACPSHNHALPIDL